MTEQTQERAVSPFAAIVREHRDGGIVARLRYRLREQKLVIGHQLVRPDDVVRASLNNIFDRLRDHYSDEVVSLGVPDSGGVAMTCFIGAR
jgi:hypothetical protein